MSWNPFKRRSKNPLGDAETERQAGLGQPLPVLDTRAAIDELSQVVKSDPEAIHTYFALGNLFRSQGEIERAIHIRNSIIVRRGLSRSLKARAWFELGRDFRRGGFLDRSVEAFEQAAALGGDKTAILLEEARLFADRRDYAAASECYAKVGQTLPQAHFLVLKAMEDFAADEASSGRRALRHALKAYPGSVEAWLETMVQAGLNKAPAKLADSLRDALSKVDKGLRFILLEGLMQALRQYDVAGDDSRFLTAEALAESVLPVLEAQEPDMLILYYAGMFLRAADRDDEASTMFERSLGLHPDFWLSRLELFEIAEPEQVMTPFFKEQLHFFLGGARKVRKFYCGKCGLKRESIFFLCPKCQSWHSIQLRTDFS